MASDGAQTVMTQPNTQILRNTGVSTFIKHCLCVLKRGLCEDIKTKVVLNMLEIKSAQARSNFGQTWLIKLPLHVLIKCSILPTINVSCWTVLEQITRNSCLISRHQLKNIWGPQTPRSPGCGNFQEGHIL